VQIRRRAGHLARPDPVAEEDRRDQHDECRGRRHPPDHGRHPLDVEPGVLHGSRIGCARSIHNALFVA
jgi:hypothetical protein